MKRSAIKRSTKPIRKRAKPRRGRERDVAYLRFISSQSCMACVTSGHPSGNSDLILGYLQCTPTEAAHVGERGLGQKCNDREAIPLCMDHHRLGKDAHHVLGKKFWKYHGLNREALIAHYNKLYQESL